MKGNERFSEKKGPLISRQSAECKEVVRRRADPNRERAFHIAIRYNPGFQARLRLDEMLPADQQQLAGERRLRFFSKSLSFPRERLHFRDGLPHLGRVCARVGSSEADFMLIFQLEMLPLLRETRYDWSYDSGSGTRPVLKRDSFRALYESFKCGVSSRLFA
jgi:hypothetical protein